MDGQKSQSPIKTWSLNIEHKILVLDLINSYRVRLIWIQESSDLVTINKSQFAKKSSWIILQMPPWEGLLVPSCMPSSGIVPGPWHFTLWLDSFIIDRNINWLRPRQNRRHFADDVFKCNFLNENVWIPIKISQKFVPKGPSNNIPALVQIMAGRRTGNKPLSEPMMTLFNDANMRHSASMS